MEELAGCRAGAKNVDLEPRNLSHLMRHHISHEKYRNEQAGRGRAKKGGRIGDSLAVGITGVARVGLIFRALLSTRRGRRNVGLELRGGERGAKVDMIHAKEL